MSAAEDTVPAWVTAAADAATRFDHGDIIQKKWLMTAFAIRTPRLAREQELAALEFMACMRRFRMRLLRDAHKLVRSDRRGGYLVVAAADHVVVAMDDTTHALAKAFGEGKAKLEHAPVELMTPAQRAARSDAQAKLAAAKAMCRQGLKG